MTVVVADTSPLNYLVLIGQIEVLPALFGRVVVPSEVLNELTYNSTPIRVREWIDSRPDWLDIRVAHDEGHNPEMPNLGA